MQTVFSGEYNHGKSSSAMITARWDTLYTKELLKIYDPEKYEKALKHLNFSIKNSVIISPNDPASKFINRPQLFRPYVVDEGILFATTQEASEKKTADLRDDIAQNRKTSPSMYWCYPNIFKMPSILLEQMMIVIHKSHVNSGIMIAPSTVIQLKEKFDKKRIERYARKPRYFVRSMKWHSGFVFYPHFGRVKGATWQRYLDKYDKYKIVRDATEGGKKESTKIKFFKQLDGLISKGTIKIEAKQDIAKYIEVALQKDKKSKYADPNLSNILANEYSDWKIDQAANQLLNSLTKATANNLKFNIESE